MTVPEIKELTLEGMQKSIDFLKNQLSKVRTGRASGNLLDGVQVEYYGTKSPISQVASVSVPDARTIVIQPFDRSTLNDVEKAIRQADLGFNPQNDGNIIRISVPPLTEERRKEFVKLSKKYAEDAKIGARNARKEGMDMLKDSEKEKIISEDEKKKGEDEVQKLTDDTVAEIDKIFQKKEKELLED